MDYSGINDNNYMDNPQSLEGLLKRILTSASSAPSAQTTSLQNSSISSKDSKTKVLPSLVVTVYIMFLYQP
jgi:hypothetical protein